MEVTVDEFMKWKRYWDKSEYDSAEVMKKMFSSFVEDEWDGHFGAFIWVTVSDDTELEAIMKFIEQKLV